MKVHHGTIPTILHHPIATIGSFDGVHRGHLIVIQSLQERARITGGESVILTFDPHPREVLYPHEPAPGILTTLEEKKEILAQIGVDHLVVLPFTRELARLSYADFVQQILVQQMGIQGLIVGHDHRLGRDRAGNFDNLQILSRRFGFFLERETVFESDHVNVSSTKIRQALSGGDITRVNRFLGRPYALSGKVVKGNQLGRTLGFPTANLAIDNARKLLPANGVYAVQVFARGTLYNGMLNVGTRPTITPTTHRVTLETHLFDFSGDLYGSTLTVQLVTRLRDERPFASLPELREQLLIDKSHALNSL